eukprot:8076720-Alexandrium_andersonii.AAC.1
MVSVFATRLQGWARALALAEQRPDGRDDLAAAGTEVGSGVGKDHSLALKGIILQLQEDMKALDRQRRATHIDEFERY